MLINPIKYELLFNHFMKKNPKNEDEYLFTEAGIIFMLKKQAI